MLSLNTRIAALHSVQYDQGFLVAVWFITAISTLAFCARLYTRVRRFTRFYWDDLFVFLAWSLSIPVAVQTTKSYRHTTLLDDGSPDIFLSRPITQLFFYTCLWAVKISFLIFFKRIGISAVEAIRKYWIGVFIFTVVTYIVLWTLNPYGCWIKKGLPACEADPLVRKLMPVTFSLATAFDIITDCLIVAIPFAILSNLRLSFRKKVVLYSLFSLEVITIVVALIRCVIVVRGQTTGTKGFDLTLLLFLTHIEANTATTVACAAALRSLFTQDDRAKSPRFDSPSPKLRIRDSSRDTIDSTDLPYYIYKISDEDDFFEDSVGSKDLECSGFSDVGGLLKTPSKGI